MRDMWKIGTTKLRIKNSVWIEFLIHHAKNIDTPNPGPRTLYAAPINTPFNGMVMLDWPLWWFHEEDVEEVWNT